MRFRHPDGTTVHLAYCSNVHPAEDVAGVLAQLDTYARPYELLATKWKSFIESALNVAPAYALVICPLEDARAT